MSAQAKYLNEHADAEIVFCKYENFVEGEVAPEISARLSSETNNRYCLPTSLIRRGMVAEVGKCDVAYRIGTDIDWLSRAKIVYDKNLDHYIDIPYYRRRFHATNIVMSEPLDKHFNSRIMMENIKKKHK